MHGSLAPFLAGLNLLAALLVIPIAWKRLAQRRPKRSATALGLAAAAVATAAFFRLVDPQKLPTGLITFLQEGNEIRCIQALYGQNIHAGPNYRFLAQALFSNQSFPRLAYLVGMNLWLALVNASLYFIIAVHVVDDIWTAAIFTLFFALNAVTLNSAASELPSQLLTLYFLLGVVAASELEDHGAGFERKDLIPIALMGALTLLALATRPETAILGAGFFLALAYRWASGSPRVVRFRSWCRSAFERASSWPAERKIAAWAAAIALGPLGRHFINRHSIEGRWIFDGLYPFNLSFLTLPLLLLYFLP